VKAEIHEVMNDRYKKFQNQSESTDYTERERGYWLNRWASMYKGNTGDWAFGSIFYWPQALNGMYPESIQRGKLWLTRSKGASPATSSLPE
jgi:hypothetical protein